MCGLFFQLQTLYLKDFSKIYQLKGLKPKNKDHTKFYECCDLMKKVYDMYVHRLWQHFNTPTSCTNAFTYVEIQGTDKHLWWFSSTFWVYLMWKIEFEKSDKYSSWFTRKVTMWFPNPSFVQNYIFSYLWLVNWNFEHKLSG